MGPDYGRFSARASRFVGIERSEEADSPSTLKVFDTSMGTVVGRIEGVTDCEFCRAALSADGAYYTVLDQSAGVHTWHLESLELVEDAKVPGLSSTNTSAPGQDLIVLTRGTTGNFVLVPIVDAQSLTFNVYSVPGVALVGTVALPQTQEPGCLACGAAVSADGTSLVVAGTRNVSRYALDSGELLSHDASNVGGGDLSITAVSADGSTAIVGSLVWDLSTAPARVIHDVSLLNVQPDTGELSLDGSVAAFSTFNPFPGGYVVIDRSGTAIYSTKLPGRAQLSADGHSVLFTKQVEGNFEGADLIVGNDIYLHDIDSDIDGSSMVDPKQTYCLNHGESGTTIVTYYY